MFKKFLLILSILIVVIPFLPSPVSAQESPWGEVIDADGNIIYSNLTDLGEIQVDADWMPDVPFIDGQATYHRYMTPSGNIVVMPSATTLFFMALNPDASGINNAYSALGNGVGVLETMLAGYISPADIASLGYASQDEFYQAVINGDVNLFTFDFMGNFLWDLITSSLADGNIYTMLLLYLAGDCDSVPGGCPATTSIPTPPPSNACPSPYILQGVWKLITICLGAEATKSSSPVSALTRAGNSATIKANTTAIWNKVLVFISYSPFEYLIYSHCKDALPFLHDRKLASLARKLTTCY